MKNYYNKEINRPLTEFLSSNGGVINIQLTSGGASSKRININLESIELLRSMLNKIETKLLKERK